MSRYKTLTLRGPEGFALGKEKVIIVNLSGRGDKDVMQVAKIKGVEL